MERVLITGANGLVGKALTQVLKTNGYEVIHLLRSAPQQSQTTFFLWNPDKEDMDEKALVGVDHIIHLAGENISTKRWTKSRKKVLVNSRVKTAEFLFSRCKNSQLKSFISASGISIYGSQTTEKIYEEDAKSASDFLADLTVKWEAAADKFAELNARVVKIRTAVVLSPSGGAIDKIVKPIRLGFGAALGTGKQYFPWIHIEDLCQIYLKALQDQSMNGAYNASSPGYCTNLEFTEAIAKQLKKSLWLPNVPTFVLKIALGEMAEIVLGGSRISAAKLVSIGFKFQFSNLEKAIQDTIRK